MGATMPEQPPDDHVALAVYEYTLTRPAGMWTLLTVDAALCSNCEQGRLAADHSPLVSLTKLAHVRHGILQTGGGELRCGCNHTGCSVSCAGQRGSVACMCDQQQAPA